MAKAKTYMQEALKQAGYAFSSDEVPVGAVIVCKDRIIAKSHNQVETLKDPTAHAEMIAITQASSYLKNKFLTGCSMYVTIEPCAMCAGALILSRIDKVYFGAKDPKTGAFGSKFNIKDLKLNHKLKMEGGLLAEESSALITKFFKSKRRKQTS